MAVTGKPEIDRWFCDKGKIRRILEETDASTGFVFDPTATVEELRELLRVQGIRPEDNLMSRDIIRARDED